MKRPRYDTGTCPRCGSICTGRLKIGNPQKTTFHFGSPIIFATDTQGHNIACASCGVFWTDTPRLVLAEQEEIDQLAEAWDYMEKTTEYNDWDEELEILDNLTDELGIKKEKKKEKSKARQITEYVIKDAALAPIKAAKEFTGNMSDVAHVFYD